MSLTPGSNPLLYDLPHAAQRGELELRYQPQVDLHDGRVTGVEALIRWQHPRLGELTPERFIDLADAIGVLPTITTWVVQRALDDWTGWHRAARVPVWVNLPGDHLARPDVMHAVTARAFSAQGGTLGVELTERAVISQSAATLRTLGMMRQLGVPLALDDFGTGLTSLLHLKQLPLSVVKIDRSFVGGLLDNRADRAIVEAAIALSHRLGFSVVAEGIETRAQCEALTRLGCDTGQGYLFARPVLAADAALLAGRDLRAMSVTSAA